MGQVNEGRGMFCNLRQSVVLSLTDFLCPFTLQGSDYYPKCFPKLPPEVLQNGNLQKQVLELASMLDVRSLFYDIGEAPPPD